MSTRMCAIIYRLIVFHLLVVHCARVKRVVGGMAVACGTEPRVVSLRNVTNDQHLCGALLVTSQYALTAAHCVYNGDPEQYFLQLNNYCVDNEDYPRAQVRDIIINEQYDRITQAHDISVLQIHVDLNDTTWLDDTVLPVSSFGIAGECTIYGYGYKDVDTKETSETLSAAKVRIMSLDDCREIVGQYISPQYDSGMICAIGDNSDTCQGDSGGPLMCNEKVQGVCSYGLLCGVSGVPGVYTSVGPHVQWIRDVMGLTQ